MKKICLLFLLSFISICSIAQGTWTQKASFGGIARGYLPIAFSIGTKAYVGNGYNSSSYFADFWEWDQTTDTWTQKANFAGSGRDGAISFAINGKGYAGTGQFVSTRYNTFYEYDPVTNIWTQKANFPGTARCYAVGFSIGNKGYVGSGGSGSSTSTQYSDFYEFNPANNTWTLKSNFSTMNRTGAIGISVGNKGYVGLGWKYSTSYQQDFWEYDTTMNTWTQKANFIGSARTVATAFSIGNKAYVGMGYNGSSEQQNFYEWDQATNIWTVKASFGGGVRASMTRGVTIGGKGYVGLGYDGTNYFADWWEYNPLDVLSASASVTHVTCNAQCNGTATTTPTGGQSPYTYSWSDGQTTATATGLCAGGYTVTVTDANLDVVTTSVTITEPAVLTASATAASSAVCNGTCTSLNSSVSGGTPPYSYLWMPGNLIGAAPIVCPVSTTTYSCTVTDANGCSANQNATVAVNALPGVTYVESQINVCINWNPVTLTPGSPAGGIYSGPGVTGTQFDPLIAGQGTWNVIYTYTDSNGCSNSVTQQITVDLCTGISTAIAFADVAIFPNPFTNVINVVCESLPVNGRIEIYDVLGQKIFFVDIAKEKTEINLSEFPAGVYYVKVVSAEGTITNQINKQ